jgi:hypothetical protein
VNPQSHIRLLLLWKYSREFLALNSEDMAHLRVCQDCVGLLWICHGSKSVEQVKAWLDDHGIPSDEPKSA